MSVIVIESAADCEGEALWVLLADGQHAGHAGHTLPHLALTHEALLCRVETYDALASDRVTVTVLIKQCETKFLIIMHLTYF